MELNDMISFEQVLEERFRDPEFRAEWEHLAHARALANRLIGRRVDRGLTQTALARQIGVSPETIRRLEIGEHFPLPQTLARIESFVESTEVR